MANGLGSAAEKYPATVSTSGVVGRVKRPRPTILSAGILKYTLQCVAADAVPFRQFLMFGRLFLHDLGLMPKYEFLNLVIVRLIEPVIPHLLG